MVAPLHLLARTAHFAATLTEAGNTFGKHRIAVWQQNGFSRETAIAVESMRTDLASFPDERPKMPFSERRRRRLLAPWTLRK